MGHATCGISIYNVKDVCAQPNVRDSREGKNAKCQTSRAGCRETKMVFFKQPTIQAVEKSIGKRQTTSHADNFSESNSFNCLQ